LANPKGKGGGRAQRETETETDRFLENRKKKSVFGFPDSDLGFFNVFFGKVFFALTDV
jgi:hypothetical protein